MKRTIKKILPVACVLFTLISMFAGCQQNATETAESIDSIAGNERPEWFIYADPSVFRKYKMYYNEDALLNPNYTSPDTFELKEDGTYECLGYDRNGTLIKECGTADLQLGDWGYIGRSDGDYALNFTLTSNYPSGSYYFYQYNSFKARAKLTMDDTTVSLVIPLNEDGEEVTEKTVYLE